jgi:hypothetical protein
MCLRRLATWFIPLLAGAVVLGVASCHRGGSAAVYPVTGNVFYKGKPAEGAQVTLVPLSDSGAQGPRPGGQVKKNGAFRLSTYRSYDGAPPGRYAVTIVYRSPERKVDDENTGPDLLKGRYGDPKTTPLTTEIRAGKNDLGLFNLP